MGGNIWSNETRRISKWDAIRTIVWLEGIVEIPLLPNMLGSTGIQAESGDIDLGLEFHYINKEILRQRLTNWCKTMDSQFDPKKWIKNSGINLHFKSPINGDIFNGFVQVDFMFGEDLEWMKFVYRANTPKDSLYKGFHRHILMSSIVKSIDPEWKWNQIVGLVERHKPSDLLITNDPEMIAKILLGEKAKVSDLDSVESIYAFLENDPDKAAKVKDFEENIAKHAVCKN